MEVTWVGPGLDLCVSETIPYNKERLRKVRGTGRYRGRKIFGSGICCREKENKKKKKRDTNSKELSGLGRMGSTLI